MRLVLTALAATTVALAGCDSGQTPEERAKACRALADEVKNVDLSSTPDEKSADEVAEALDDRITELRDEDAHSAAVELHTSLHAVAHALEDGDNDHAARATERARNAAREAAAACGLTPADFGLTG